MSEVPPAVKKGATELLGAGRRLVTELGEEAFYSSLWSTIKELLKVGIGAGAIWKLLGVNMKPEDSKKFAQLISEHKPEEAATVLKPHLWGIGHRDEAIMTVALIRAIKDMMIDENPESVERARKIVSYFGSLDHNIRNEFKDILADIESEDVRTDVLIVLGTLVTADPPPSEAEAIDLLRQSMKTVGVEGKVEDEWPALAMGLTAFTKRNGEARIRTRQQISARRNRENARPNNDDAGFFNGLCRFFGRNS